MAEQAAHWRSARLCRMFFGEFYLHAVMTCLAERVNIDLLLTTVQHVVELLVSSIERKFFCLLLTGDRIEYQQNSSNNRYEKPVFFSNFHPKASRINENVSIALYEREVYERPADHHSAGSKRENGTNRQPPADNFRRKSKSYQQHY